MGTSDLDLEEYDHAVECAVEAGVFKKGRDGQVYIVVKEPAKAAQLMESAGNDNEVVARIVKIVSSASGRGLNIPVQMAQSGVALQRRFASSHSRYINNCALARIRLSHQCIVAN